MKLIEQGNIKENGLNFQSFFNGKIEHATSSCKKNNQNYRRLGNKHRVEMHAEEKSLKTFKILDKVTNQK